jgi:proline iminopeptidase
MPVFAVTTAKGANWDHARDIREQAYWDEHGAFNDKLVDRGVIIIGGPVGGGDLGDIALLAVEAADEEAARSVFDADPWTTHQVFRVQDVRPWRLWLDGRSRLDGGVRRVRIDTPSGQFTVWTKRVGDHPAVKVLLLHGGPGATHEYLTACDGYLPGAGIEYYYYDQLGSGRSDQPDDPSLWQLDRFVDEVEQVRLALGLDRENFVLYGQSWGGILAMEYALAHQDHLRGLVISNMMASAPAYTAYAEQVLMPTMDQQVLAEIKALEAAGDTDNPRYMELLVPHYYEHHTLRMPEDSWPDPVKRAFAAINHKIYVPMQGPSELGMSEQASLARWDRVADLPRIEVPTLVIGARYDTMDPGHMEMMAARLPNGRYLYCPNGSHLAMWDDQETYFAGLLDFLAGLSSYGNMIAS